MQMKHYLKICLYLTGAKLSHSHRKIQAAGKGLIWHNVVLLEPALAIQLDSFAEWFEITDKGKIVHSNQGWARA